jgi:glyoxylase-like metal-dependent hydrolase (beta-lactamase superfamily II)
MLTKVKEDIYKLAVRFPFGMREVNSYLIQGEKGFTVIDTGSSSKESINLWERTLSSGIEVEKVVLTHAHPDHIGLAGWFQERNRVPVFISALGNKEIQRFQQRKYENSNRLNTLLKQHGGLGIPKEMMLMESAAYDFEPDGIFENNQNMTIGNSVYQSIWTPGHAPDHFCFYNSEQQVMIIGDHVLNHISPIIGITSDEEDNPLKDYFSSLELIKGYPTVLALPGHGDPIVNLKDRVEEIIYRHQHRLKQVLESVRDEWKTAYNVCQEIYGQYNMKNLLSPFMSTITRFIYLESIEKVKSELRNGELVFQAKQT